MYYYTSDDDETTTAVSYEALWPILVINYPVHNFWILFLLSELLDKSNFESYFFKEMLNLLISQLNLETVAIV